MAQPPQDPFDPSSWKKPTQQPQNPSPNFQQGNSYPSNPNTQNPYQQPPPWQLQGQVPYSMPRTLPNAGAVLTLGIISIIGSFCYVLPGLICAIIALVMGSNALKTYNENPGAYSAASYNNVKAGRICAIIGLVISALIVIAVILVAVFAAQEHSGYRHYHSPY